jgi:hypothetical protein
VARFRLLDAFDREQPDDRKVFCMALPVRFTTRKDSMMAPTCPRPTRPVLQSVFLHGNNAPSGGKTRPRNPHEIGQNRDYCNSAFLQSCLSSHAFSPPSVVPCNPCLTSVHRDSSRPWVEIIPEANVRTWRTKGGVWHNTSTPDVGVFVFLCQETSACQPRSFRPRSFRRSTPPRAVGRPPLPGQPPSRPPADALPS